MKQTKIDSVVVELLVVAVGTFRNVTIDDFVALSVAVVASAN